MLAFSLHMHMAMLPHYYIQFLLRAQFNTRAASRCPLKCLIIKVLLIICRHNPRDALG